MNQLQRVLLLEKSQADINSIIQQVKRINSKSEFQSAISKVDFEQKLKNFKPDLILANYKLPGLPGIKALEIAQTHAPDTPFIFVTDAQDEETAAECIKRGASDYILKTNLKRLVPAIENVLKSFQKQTKETSVVNTLTDTSKQKDVLAALQTSEKMFRKMADNIPDGLIIIEHGKVKFFNDRICQITGYPPAEIVNLNFIDLAAPEEKERLAEVVKEEQKTGYGPRELEFWIVRQDGTRRYLHNRYSYSREAGKIATRYIITTDLTEHKEAEQSHEQERVLLKTLIDHLPNSIFIKDQDFKKILVNSAHLARVTTTLGHADPLTEGDLLGKTDFEVYPQNLAEEYYAEDQRVIKSGETILNKEQFSFDQNSQPYWELISKIPLRNKDGSIIGMVGIANDITTIKQAEEALRGSEEKYRSLAESSKDSIYLVDENGYFLFANQTYLARLGQPLEKIIGKSYSEFHPSADTQKFLSKIRQVFSKRKWLSYEHQSHRDKCYFIRTLSPVNSPVEDQTIAVTVISKDITERKEMEEALRESERKLKDAQILGRVGSWEFDIKSQTITWSDQTYSLYERDPLLGPPTVEEETAYYAPDQARILREFARRAIEEGKDFEYDLQAILPSRKRIFFTARMHPVKDAHNRVVRLFGTVQDITERKQAEEALRQSEHKYRTLFTNSRDGIAMADLKGKIFDCNQAYTDMLDYSSEELKHLKYLDLTPKKWHKQNEKMVNMVMEQGYSEEFEKEYIKKDGTVIPVSLRTWRIDNEEGKPIGIGSIVRDITERQQMIKALRESEEIQRFFSKRLTRILAVINQLSPIESFNELCRQAVELGIKELGFSRVGLWFLSKDLKTMQGSYGTDESGSIRDERHIQLPVADFAVSKVLKSKQQVIFLKNEVLVGKDAKPIGHGNHAIAKLIAGNKIIGILGVDNLINKRPITEQDQEILGLYATALANLYMLKKTEEKLKATQKIYQQAIQNAHGIPYLLNYINNRYDFIGEDCQQVLGISPNQMSLTKLKSLIKESHVNISGAPKDENTAVELFKSGKVDYYQSDIKIVTPKGQTKWLSDSAVPYKDEISGKIVGSLGILQEITDRKRSEAVQHVLYQITNAIIETTDLSQFLDFIRQALGEIIDTTNFFVALYDKQNDSLTLPYFVDQKDRFTSFPAGRSLTGYIIKKNQPLLVYEQDIKKMAAKGVIDLIGTPSKVWLGVPIMHRNEVLGAVVVQSYTDQNAYHQNDLEVLKFISNQIGVLIDRKQADVALRASEERFRSVFEDSPVGIALYNTNGNFIECNSEFFNILGITDRQLIQQINLFEIAILKNNIKKDLFQRKSVKFEQEINFDNWQSPHLHHGVIYLNVLIAPFHTERSVFNYLVQIQNITDRKKIEQELLRSEKLESIGMLAGGIAHDFNNILTGILGNVSLARIYAKDDEIINERLSEAEKAVMRARDLTQRLLTFSKGGLPIKKITNIANLVEESAKFVLAGSKAKSIIQKAADLWAVEADEGQINQVLNNIIINADQAMPEGGIINIQVENYLAEANIVRSLNPGKYIKISITDQGIGIPSEHLSKIFDPYFTTKKRGSGLGLATAFSIVKNHNGKIEVVSELGKGSTFTIYLPATEAVAEVPEQVREEQPLGEGRVLVVDDEKIVREVVAEMIRRLGYEVNAVKDGREAIAQYQQNLAANQPYAAIIMDLTIPGGMGGKEAISQLLAIDPDAKVIVSSGYSTDPIMSNFSQYGFKGVVAKPYDLYELGKVLKKVITGK